MKWIIIALGIAGGIGGGLVLALSGDDSSRTGEVPGESRGQIDAATSTPPATASAPDATPTRTRAATSTDEIGPERDAPPGAGKDPEPQVSSEQEQRERVDRDQAQSAAEPVFADRSWEQRMARQKFDEQQAAAASANDESPTEQPSLPQDDPAPAPESTPDPRSAVGAETPTLTPENCETYRQSFPLYGDPQAQAIRVERELRETDPEAAALLRQIACVPKITWLVSGGPGAVREQARAVTVDAARVSKIPVLAIYSTPGHWEPEWYGWKDGASYEEWIRAIGEGIDERRAWVILEPDALLLSMRYDEAGREKRIAELARAADILREEAPNIRLYLDAGHSKWGTVEETAELIAAVGAERFAGFTLNVSNFHPTEGEKAYGRAVSDALGGDLHFIIDTSRNGNGAPDTLEWCNPSGRAIGEHPTFATGDTRLDALLWIKPPGESDETCNGGPPAGKFWLEYALDLVRNRS